MTLSAYQSAAVNAPKGGLFISAGAGSGKTRVLTARFVRLADERRTTDDVRPLDSLVAITFTEKAAGELSQRIRGSLVREVGVDTAREADAAWVSTIHGLCRRLLKRHAFEAGLDPMFTVCDEVTSGVLGQAAFETALEMLSGSPGVQRLLGDYDVHELVLGTRTVYEHVRSLGLSSDALSYTVTELEGPLSRARAGLRSTLEHMTALDGRGLTEERNIDHLAGLVQALDEIDAASPESGLAVLRTLAPFKQNKGCRACAKPFVLDAESLAEALRQAAAGQAADGYAVAFLELLGAYSREYALAKGRLGVLDFEDLQLRARDLLRARPDIAEEYRALLSEVMVDEFQDTNELQLSVVSELAGEALATVGDEKQSIYGWRNADVEVFRRRQRQLGEERTFLLPENFRSHPELVTFFNELFSAEPFWPQDAMRLEVGSATPESSHDAVGAWPQDVPRVQITLLDGGECAQVGKTIAEAEAVADYFESLHEAGVPQKDLVILLRAMTRAELFEGALRARGFDVYVASGGTFFDTPEAEELEALLRLLGNTRDDEAFTRLLSGRMANVSDDALYLLRRESRTAGGVGGRSLFEAARDPARAELAPTDEVALRGVIQVITELRKEAGRTSLYDLIRRGCERLDYDVTLMATGQARAWANVLKFARLAGEYERLTPGDPSAFLEHLAERRRHARYEQQAAVAAEDVDAIRIMSVHAAKGLEFPVVAFAELGNQPPNGVPTFDCGSPDERLTLAVRLPAGEEYTGLRDTPSSTAVQNWRMAREREEAKRVCYVAATRATRALALFAVLDLTKEPPADRPIGWILQAAGIHAAEGPSADGTAASLTPEMAAGDSRTPTPVSYDSPLGDVAIRVSRVAPAPRPSAPTSSRVAFAEQDTVLPDKGGDPGDSRGRQGPFRTGRISYTGIQTYVVCPYRYYATYIARIGTLDEPEAADSARTVGTAVHQALRVAGADARPSDAQFEALGERFGLDGGTLDRVRDAVNCFLDSALGRETLRWPRVLHEVPFGVDVDGTTLDGAMDLIALSGTCARVVDFKTGTGDTSSDTVQRWRLQSVCYALGVFGALPTIEDIEVIFVKLETGGTERRFAYRRSELAAIRSEIRGIVARIDDAEFKPRTTYRHGTCSECPVLGTLCRVQRPRTARRSRS